MEPLIDELKRYVRFTDDDGRRLGAIGPRVQPHFRRIALEFYERIREHEEAHAVFTGEAQIERLQDSMVRWLERVFGGVYDEAYFDKTALIGRVHVKVGLPQRYMITAMSVIRSSLLPILEEHEVGDGHAIFAALSRLLDIELAVMLETYRSDVIARVERAAQHERDERDRRADRAEEQYVKAVELAPLLVVGLDRNGAILLFNREAERATGYARDEVFGRSFVTLFVPEELQDELRSLPIPFAKSDVPTDAPLRTRTGKIRCMRWQIATAPSDDGDGDGVTFMIGSDVTDEQIERERHQQEKRLAAVGTLAAGLAHEIRNPLNGARLHLAFLERTLTKEHATADSREAVNVVVAQIQRLADLVTDFLDFARPRSVVWAPVNARSLCERAIQLVDVADARIGVTTDFPARDLVFDGDPQRLEQVILNLLQNAVEALTSGGTVTVRVRREPLHARIEIEDDGPGIPSVDAPIFDAFYSTKANGTGLGLAIVHRIVTDHAGSVDVESRPGSTRFRLKIPLTRRAKESS